VEHLATVALYSRSAISSVCQTRAVLYYIFYALPGERSLRDSHDSSRAKVQADAGNGVDRRYEIDARLSTAESHRLDKTPGVRTRENKSVGGIVAFYVRKAQRSDLCVSMRCLRNTLRDIRRD